MYKYQSNFFLPSIVEKFQKNINEKQKLQHSEKKIEERRETQ